MNDLERINDIPSSTSLYSKEYNTWNGIFDRVLHNKQKRHESYREIIIAPCFYKFSNFLRWIKSQPNYEKWKNSNKYEYCLDKDLLHPELKCYSPYTCRLIANTVNSAFTSGRKIKGCCFDKKRKKWEVKLTENNVNRHIAYCKTEIEARELYKKVKREHINRLAEEEYSKGNITLDIYNAMLNWEI